MTELYLLASVASPPRVRLFAPVWVSCQRALLLRLLPLSSLALPPPCSPSRLHVAQAGREPKEMPKPLEEVPPTQDMLPLQKKLFGFAPGLVGRFVSRDPAWKGWLLGGAK